MDDDTARDDSTADAAELRALQAAVFGRGFAGLPAPERAALEGRLAALLASQDARRAAATRDTAASPEPLRAADAAPAPLREADASPAPGFVPDFTAARPARWRRVARHPVALGALALLLVIGGTAVGVQVAEQTRDSLEVFRVPPQEQDALPEWAALPNRLDSRYLGEFAGFAVFGARTEDNRVCLIAIERGETTGAGACVEHSVFAEHGVRVSFEPDVQRGGAVAFAWGPVGPARLVATEAG